MKVDKGNLLHWLRLALFATNVALAIVVRRLKGGAGTRRVVVLYGHKLGGNLLALQRRLAIEEPSLPVVFLSMDPDYCRRLESEGVACQRATAAGCISLLASVRLVVSDHGLHALAWMVGRSDLRFVDVWHGIPYKGFDAADFKIQHRFDECWMASPLLCELYAGRFGFRPERLYTTGYARTDKLVELPIDRRAILARLGLADREGRKFVLFAPTWKQDSQRRSLYPFGIPEEEFLSCLGQACEDAGAVLVVRKHLNSGGDSFKGGGNIVHLCFSEYPDTEEILLVSDLLICDWSSIAFDFLLLDRPTIFLDVDPPFRKGFSLGPEFRYGAVTDSMEHMLERVSGFLVDPASYHQEFGERADSIRKAVYGDFADGRSSARCTVRVRALLES